MVSPRPSATVVLARDSASGPELLFVKRRSGDAFGEAYTFPGGVLDADEHKARPYCEGLSPRDANALLELESGGLDYYSAGVRELFEETGILLGAPGPVDEALRTRLHDGALSWPELLGELGFAVPCASLHYFAHWITPEALAKRWTTRFFLSGMPEGQSARPDGIEVTDYCWLTADDAVRSARSGEREIPFPTRVTAEWLAGKATVAELIDWTRERQSEGVRAILPTIGSQDGKRRIFMPDIAD